MSYDLHLYPRLDRPPLEREAFLAAFEGDLWTVEGDEANYHNEATGVYFHLTWYPGQEEVEEPNAVEEAFRARPYAHFNMNFCRPSFFAREAAVELGSLVRRFSLAVNDPQGHMEGDEYSEEGFVGGWSKSNAWAHKAVIASSGGRALAGKLTRPAEINRVFWAWNYNRDDTAEDLAMIDDIGAFVPQIMFYREGDEPRSFCIVPNLVPTVVPKVDRVLVLRSELPEPYEDRAKEAPGWVTWDELRAACPGFDTQDFCAEDCPDLPYFILHGNGYESRETAPEWLAEWVIGLPDWPGRPDMVTADDILDAELVND